MGAAEWSVCSVHASLFLRLDSASSGHRAQESDRLAGKNFPSGCTARVAQNAPMRQMRRRISRFL